MPEYTELAIVIVNKKHLDLFKESCEIAAENLQKHGALEYRLYISQDKDETWVDLLPDFKKSKATHSAVFTWTTYKSPNHRNDVKSAILADKEKRVFPESKMKKIDAHPAWVGDYQTFIR